jgi:hypothetical protein
LYLKVTGWFYSFEINNWHGLFKGKKCNNEKSKKMISPIIVRQRKGTFFGKRYRVKCAKDKEQCRKEKAEKELSSQIYANKLYQRKLL